MQTKYKGGGMSHILEDVFFVGPRDDLDFRNDLLIFFIFAKRLGFD